MNHETEKKPKYISIVVPVKNMASTLPFCLSALKKQNGFIYHQDYEIIVVDDGSSDDSKQIAEQEGVLVIRQNSQGAGAARNTGVMAALGSIVAFTDADCEPHPDWLRTIIKAFDDPKVVGVKGTYLTIQKNWVARFVQLEYASKYQRMRKFSNIDFIDTYSAAYRKNVFIQNHGFNDIFPPGSSNEDQEFSFRLATKGYLLKFVPDAKVFHTHDETIKEYFLRKYKIGYWKSVLLQWLPEKTLSDSHTLPSQRWQIIYLALIVFLSLLSIFFPNLWILVGLLLLLFLISSFPFLKFVINNDPEILLLAPLMLFVRSGALGWGLICGLLFPPKTKNEHIHGLNFKDRVLKRGLDILLSLIGLIGSIPILFIAAILIKMEDGGPILFSQLRAGENGKPFRLLKLRTMCLEAEELLDRLVDIQNLESPAYKINNDPRVTKIGRFLRRWSIDEIPQFINVLKGEMSLVGPRPEEMKIVAIYKDFERQRLIVKPGMSGPMQINGRGSLSFNQRLLLELDYIQNYSLRWDLEIIFRTIPAILNGKGAY